MFFTAKIKFDSDTYKLLRTKKLICATIGKNVFQLIEDIYYCTEVVDLPILLSNLDIEVVGTNINLNNLVPDKFR